MALRKDITVSLQTTDAQPVPACAVGEEGSPIISSGSGSISRSELSKLSTSTSNSVLRCFILGQEATTHGAPFQVVIESATRRPAEIPLECDVLRIRVLVGGTVVIQSKEVKIGEQERMNVILREEGLRFACADGSAAAAADQESTSDANPDNFRTIQVQLIPCRRVLLQSTTREESVLEPIPDCTLLYTFTPRTPAPQQHRIPSLPDLAGHNRPRSTSQVQLEESHNNNNTESKTSEYNICCGRIFPGAPPDPITGRIAYTGIVVCSNEWCQRLGQAWHKSCAGLEIWEEPEGVWFCPECRVRPAVEMEVRFS